MQLGPDDAAAAVERQPLPAMRRPRRQRLPDPRRETAAKYHTARFILVP